MKLRIEDWIFWILIALIIATAIWLLSGSPTEVNALITIALSVAASEMILWKAMFSMQKKTEVGFINVKGDLNLIKNEISYIRKDTDEIIEKLKKLENLIK